MVLFLFFSAFIVLSIFSQTAHGFCYYGTEYKNDTRCFQFYRTPLNFTNALRFCRVNANARLARNLGAERNKQLTDAAAKLGIEEFWIGASNVDADWEWLDGSGLNYSNFDVEGGYPMKTESQVGAVSMQSLSGLWYTKIDTIKLPFVCENSETEDYDQGILYRAPKTRGLRFPYGGANAPVVLVQSADQSILYDKIGPQQSEVETGEKIYLKPIVTGGAFPPLSINGQKAIVILNPRRMRKKVKPVIVSETETDVNRTMKESNSQEFSKNMIINGGNGTILGNSLDGILNQELSQSLKNASSKEATELIKKIERTIQRG